MNQRKRPAYAEAMAKELSRLRVELERARAELQHRPNPKTRRRMGDASRKLVTSLVVYGQLGEALSVQSQWIDRLESQLLRGNHRENQIILAQALEQRAVIFERLDRQDSCRQDNARAVELYRSAAEEPEGEASLGALGAAELRLGLLQEDGRTLLQAGIEHCRAAAESADTPENRRLLRDGYERLAEYYAASDDIETAERCLGEAAALARIGMETTDAPGEERAEFFRSFSCEGGTGRDDQLFLLIQQMKRWKEAAVQAAQKQRLARMLAEEACCHVGKNARVVQVLAAGSDQIRSTLETESDPSQLRSARADLFCRLGSAYRQAAESGIEGSISARADGAMARIYFEKALPLLEQLLNEGRIDVRNGYASCCEALGAHFIAGGQQTCGREFYCRGLALRRELAQTTDDPICHRALARDLHSLGMLLERGEAFEEAKAYYEQEETVLEALFAENGSFADREGLRLCFEALSGVCRSMGDFRSARNYILRKAQIG